MGRISDEDIAKVRDATDLAGLVGERVVLRPKGRLMWGCCPFHGEKTPSFKVDPATQLWHCFGCGAGGDAFGFMMRIENVDFPDAVRTLADRAHIEIAEEGGPGVARSHKERIIEACEEAARFYGDVLSRSREASAAGARDYLGGRGFGSDVARTWRLGFAPGRGALVRHLREKGFSADEMVDGNLALRDGSTLKDRFYERIMFPIAGLDGRVIAFGGRVLGKGEPKYLNTNDTPVFKKSANLYAIDRAKATITSTGTAIVVEGYTDVIALHSAGLTNTVATLGTALTRQHVRTLTRFARRVVYLFDGDAAGQRAADRAVEFIDSDITPEAGRNRVDLLVAVIPDGLDPADFVSERGADALQEVVDAASPLLRFAIDRRLARWDLNRPEERNRALAEAAQVVAPIKESTLAADYANYIANAFQSSAAVGFGAMSVDAVMRAIRSAKPVAATETPGDGSAPTPELEAEVLLTPQQRAERELLALLVRVPSERGRARQLLAEGLLSHPLHVEMAKAIGEAGETVRPSVLAGTLEERAPGAAAALAAADVPDPEDLEPTSIARDLVRRIKEMDLERRIAEGKARLKRPESLKDDAEYDEVFMKVSTLQRELEALRSGAHTVD